MTVPVDGGTLDWPRKVANAINGLLRRVETPQRGNVRYQGGALEYWNGTAWVAVP